MAALIYVQYQRSHWVPASHVLFVVLACTAIGVATVRGRPEFARLGAAALIIVIFIDPAGQRVVSQLRDDSGKAAAEQLVDQYQDTGGAAGWLLAQQATEGPFRFFGYDLGLVTDRKRTRDICRCTLATEKWATPAQQSRDFPGTGRHSGI